MFQKNVTLRNQWKFKEEKKIWGKKKKRIWHYNNNYYS